MKKKRIIIIGSGLAGSFLAVLLAQKGYKVDLYERLSKSEICDAASKRSYNIVLFGYGITLLKKAGLWESIEPYLLSLKGTVTHIANTTKPSVSFVDNKKLPYFTITRATLADILLKEAAKHHLVTVHYETALLSINRHQRTIVVKQIRTKEITTVTCDVLIGADGTNSLVRSFLQQGQHSHHIQEFANWNYKQFTLSVQMVKELNLQEGFVHTWTQKDSFITLHPNNKKELGAMLVFPKNTSSQMSNEKEIILFFKENFPEFLPLINDLTKQILTNPLGNFATIHTDPWYYKDFITIVGDAAHGFYPFFGQGTTAAFSDCITLGELIDTHNSDWEKIFSEYQQIRKKHTDTLGELSKEVLHKYLRNKKADKEAIYDKLELMAYSRFPTIVHKPLSQAIITDPIHAADYKEIDENQRKLAKQLGISFFISFTGIILGTVEKILKKTAQK